MGARTLRKPRIEAVQLLSSYTEFDATEIAKDCNWSDYDFILAEMIFYSNTLTSTVTSKITFDYTSSGSKIYLYNPTDNTKCITFYKKDASSIYVRCSWNAKGDNIGLRIIGFRSA